MSSSSSHGESSSEDDCYGPALPPHLANKSPDCPNTVEIAAPQLPQTVSVIGPQLPPHLTKNDLAMMAPVVRKSTKKNNGDKGRPGPEHDEDEEEDADLIGPYLPDDPRSQLVPKVQLPAPKETIVNKREEWMLICPKTRSLAAGLGPRTFLGRTPDELVFDKEVRDGSGGEDDDQEDEEKDDFLEVARAELADKSEMERDLQMELIMDKVGGGTESLLSIHRKRKLVEDKDGGEAKERRPFDRDVDLKVGGLSKEDKDKFIKRSEELMSRFKGGKKKFL